MSMTPSSRPAVAEPAITGPAGAGRGTARPLTGRRVLAYVLAFFLLIIAVNGLMATLASRSFRGVVADNGYAESLRFAAFEKGGLAALQAVPPPPGTGSDGPAGR